MEAPDTSSPVLALATVPVPVPRPPSPEHTVTAAPSSQLVRRCARMSTGGRKPDRLARKEKHGPGQLNFATKSEIAQKGQQ